MNKNRDLIIVAGCGRMGANIASLLSSQGKDVVVIDTDPSSFKKLPVSYKGFFMEGDATDTSILAKAGIEKSAIVVAATDDDNANIMISQIASEIYKVPKVVSRLYDTEKQGVYQGLSISIIMPAKLSLGEFEKMLIPLCPEGVV